MDVKTFESIKDKITVLETKKSKAEWALESLVESWKKDFGVSTVEELREKLEKWKAELATIEGSIESLYAELASLTNWAAL